MPLHLAADEPLRLQIAVPGGTFAEVEVRDLPRPAATAAAQAALTELFKIVQLAEMQGEGPGTLHALQAAAGQGPQPLAPHLAEILRRSLQFCAWSGGAHGPLGGELLRLWQELDDQALTPDPGALRSAVIQADCRRLRLSSASAGPTAELTAGSRIAVRGMARGYAMDRAFAVLAEHGVKNAWVEIGNIYRAMGGGPSGEGWPMILPAAPGSDEPLDQLWLRDQALVMIGLGDNAQAANPPLIDQRTGSPARGVVAVVTVTSLAADAVGLAEALAIIGMRDGQMRLGSLTPRPSIYWLLGERTGTPLASTYRWSDLPRIR